MKKEGVVDMFIKENDDILDEIKTNTCSNILVIFDDMLNSDHLKSIAELYTVQIRHCNLNAIFLTQKLFVNNEYFRQISGNSDYFVLFKNPRNTTDIRVLSGQMTPGSNELVQIYNKATEKPYSYLFVNLTQSCPHHLRFLSCLFKDNYIVNVYITSDCSIDE